MFLAGEIPGCRSFGLFDIGEQGQRALLVHRALSPPSHWARVLVTTSFLQPTTPSPCFTLPLFCFILCNWVFCLHICLYYLCVYGTHKYHMVMNHHECSDSNQHPPEEQPGLVTAESPSSSLMPPASCPISRSCSHLNLPVHPT